MSRTGLQRQLRSLYNGRGSALFCVSTVRLKPDCFVATLLAMTDGRGAALASAPTERLNIDPSQKVRDDETRAGTFLIPPVRRITREERMTKQKADNLVSLEST